MMDRRSFLQVVTALAAGLRFWRPWQPSKPTVSLPTFDGQRSLVQSGGMLYRLVRVNRRVRKGELVYWDHNGQIAGAAVTHLRKGHHGFIQISNVPIVLEVKT